MLYTINNKEIEISSYLVATIYNSLKNFVTKSATRVANR